MCDPETQKKVSHSHEKQNKPRHFKYIYNKQTKPWHIPSTVANRQHGLALLKVDIFPTSIKPTTILLPSLLSPSFSSSVVSQYQQHSCRRPIFSPLATFLRGEKGGFNDSSWVKSVCIPPAGISILLNFHFSTLPQSFLVP